jgi:hypothetical protein
MLTCLALLALASGTLGTASADSVDRQIAKAQGDRATARQAAAQVQQRVDALTAAYEQSRAALDAATQGVLGAYRQRLVISAQLAEAQSILNRQAASAYENGPGLSIEMMLESSSPADLASVQIFTARAIGMSGEAIGNVKALRLAMDQVSGALERRQAELAATVNELESLASQALVELAAAQDVARTAGLTVKGLKQRQLALAQARASSDAAINALANAKRGLDQTALLALLGASGGRGCDLPPGLQDTGQRIGGIASWYGWDFAGRPTATGAIYDPRLFTAANKELPLNSFLRVHFNGRCAVVLVNDRGPYKPGRVFDLSQAAAEYLGVGLNDVVADVLLPV